MDAIVNLIVDLVGKIVAVVAAGDKEKERQALLAVASKVNDEAAKRTLGF